MKYIFVPRKSNAKAIGTYIGHTDDTDGHCTIRSKDRENFTHEHILYTHFRQENWKNTQVTAMTRDIC